MIKKSAVVFAALFLVCTVCFAQNVSVETFTDDEQSLATIDVSLNDKGELKDASESDIILSVKEQVDRFKNAGIEKVVLRINAPQINEENAAKLADGIDVICVYDKIGSNKKVGDTLIVYEKIINESQNADIQQENEPARNESFNSLSSMLILTLVLLAAVIILYFVLKKRQTDKK